MKMWEMRLSTYPYIMCWHRLYLFSSSKNCLFICSFIRFNTRTRFIASIYVLKSNGCDVQTVLFVAPDFVAQRKKHQFNSLLFWSFFKFSGQNHDICDSMIADYVVGMFEVKDLDNSFAMSNSLKFSFSLGL